MTKHYGASTRIVCEFMRAVWVPATASAKALDMIAVILAVSDATMNRIHPTAGDWFMIYAETEAIGSQVEQVVRKILKDDQDGRLGS